MHSDCWETAFFVGKIERWKKQLHACVHACICVMHDIHTCLYAYIMWIVILMTSRQAYNQKRHRNRDSKQSIQSGQENHNGYHLLSSVTHIISNKTTLLWARKYYPPSQSRMKWAKNASMATTVPTPGSVLWARGPFCLPDRCLPVD